MKIIADATFIDVFFLILFLRTSYIAFSRGFITEIFKTLGVIAGSIFTFHYFPVFAQKLAEKIPFLNKTFLNSFSFLLTLFVSLIFFSLLRKIANAFFEKKEISPRQRMISLFIGWIRFGFLASIIIFFLYLASFNAAYLKRSLSFPVLRPLAPKTYLISVSLYGKFNPKITLNKEVEEYYEAKEPLSGNNKEGN